METQVIGMHIKISPRDARVLLRHMRPCTAYDAPIENRLYRLYRTLGQNDRMIEISPDNARLILDRLNPCRQDEDKETKDRHRRVRWDLMTMLARYEMAQIVREAKLALE